LSTFLIGLLPTYDTWGVYAPIALIVLRLLQGACVGGEWGGAATISTESAPENRRYCFGSFTQRGSPAGTVTASGMVAIATVYGTEVLIDWAWRVPFWFAGVLVIASVIIRARMSESPEFEEDVIKKEKSPSLVRTFRDNWV